MIIGVPKEIKDNENRVALTLAGVTELVNSEHKVIIQTDAGLGSGFSNDDYLQVGAEIVDTAAKGVNTTGGYCTYKAVAETFNLDYHDVQSLHLA